MSCLAYIYFFWVLIVKFKVKINVFFKFCIKYEIIFYKNQNSQKGAKAFIRLKKTLTF